MNENIDLTKILKNCPKGWEFYSPFMGDVKFYEVDQKVNTVVVILKSGGLCDFNEDGTIELEGITSDEIMLYPSRDQRDWSKFTNLYPNRVCFFFIITYSFKLNLSKQGRIKLPTFWAVL